MYHVARAKDFRAKYVSGNVHTHPPQCHRGQSPFSFTMFAPSFSSALSTAACPKTRRVTLNLSIVYLATASPPSSLVSGHGAAFAYFPKLVVGCFLLFDRVRVSRFAFAYLAVYSFLFFYPHRLGWAA